MTAVLNVAGQKSLTFDVPLSRDWWFIKLIAFALLVGVGFWFIDHDFFASERYLFADEIFEVENYTADSIEQAGMLSAPIRMFLGLLGGILLLLPSRQEIKLVNLVSLVFFCVVGLFVVSVLWSVNPRVTLQKCGSLVFLVLAAAGTAKHFSLRELNRVFPAICIGYIVFGGIVELSMGNFRPWLGQYRFVGTVHPNTLAVYASVCALAAAAFRRRAGDSMYWPLILVVVALVTLMLTKSRTTTLALLFALVSMGYLQLSAIQRVFVISALLTLLAIFGLVLSLQSTSTIDSLSGSLALGRTENVSNLTGRLPLWEELGRFIQRRPLMGYGYLAFWDSARVQYLSDALGWEIPHGHNMYIDLLLDVGVIGLCLFAGFLVACLATSVDRYRIYGDAATATVFGLVIFAIVHGSGESLFKLPNFLMFVLITYSLRLGFLPRNLSPNSNRLVYSSHR